MPTLNLLTAETQGVDMKINPLFLGDKKVHSATNFAFEEGRIFTRPGFNYRSLGLRGQFQGATFYSPSKGLSYIPFSDPISALITVVAGEVHVNDTTTGILACEANTIPGSNFFICKGDVEVFQAENYLIVQSPLTSTYWWTGRGALERSPGLAERKDGCMDFVPEPDRILFVPPPRPFDITIIVRDKVTLVPLEGANLTLRNSGGRTYQAVTDPQGKIKFHLHSGAYQQDVLRTYFYESRDFLDLKFPGTYYVDLIRLPDLEEDPDKPKYPNYPSNPEGPDPTRCNLNVTSFLSDGDGSIDLNPYFSNPVLPEGDNSDSYWRLMPTTSPEAYYTGPVSPEGFLLKTTPTNVDTAYFSVEDNSFVSEFGYSEPMHVQVGCVSAGNVVWPAIPDFP